MTDGAGRASLRRMADSKEERLARQAAALRRNLQQRKAQDRARRLPPAGVAEAADSDRDSSADPASTAESLPETPRGAGRR